MLRNLSAGNVLSMKYYYYYKKFDYNVKFTGELKLSYSYVALSLKKYSWSDYIEKLY